jgi:hypothetical protein
MFQPRIKTFIPNMQFVSAIIFGFGIITAFVILCGLIVAAAYILNIAVTTFCEIAHHIAILYSSSDSIVQLCLLCIAGYLLVKIVRSAYRSLK